MKKLTFLGVFFALVLFGIYRINTSKSLSKIDGLNVKLSEKKKLHKRLVNINSKDQERINYYRNNAEKLKISEVIVEYNSTNSLALQSEIIRTIAEHFIKTSEGYRFFERELYGESKFIASVIIKNLSSHLNEKSFKIIKTAAFSSHRFEDETYANMLISMTKFTGGEEQKSYIEKLKSIVFSLKSGSQRNVLKTLLDVTNGDKDVIDLINRKLLTINDLAFEMFAMTHLSKYDTTWIDANRDKLRLHKNENIRILFLQSLKYYCPKDMWVLLEEGLEDNQQVKSIILRELILFSKRSLPFLERNKSKFNVSDHQLSLITKSINKKDKFRKTFCPRLK